MDFWAKFCFWAQNRLCGRPAQKPYFLLLEKSRFWGPRGPKTHFWPQKSLFGTKVRFGPQNAFWVPKTVFGPQAPLWLPGAAIWPLFLKGLSDFVKGVIFNISILFLMCIPPSPPLESSNNLRELFPNASKSHSLFFRGPGGLLGSTRLVV